MDKARYYKPFHTLFKLSQELPLTPVASYHEKRPNALAMYTAVIVKQISIDSILVNIFFNAAYDSSYVGRDLRGNINVDIATFGENGMELKLPMEQQLYICQIGRL